MHARKINLIWKNVTESPFLFGRAIVQEIVFQIY